MTILIFIIVLSILVFVHEFGHFITAKRAGMKVEEFGFGFPPRIFGIKRGETTYSVNWIPFGGFVKILGENGEEKDDPRSFAAAGAKTRAWVIVAGVVMNILFAMLLLAIGNTVGIRVGLIDEEFAKRASDIRIQIIQTAQNSPAEEAGITVLDEIVSLSVDGEKTVVTEIRQIQDFINANLGREIVLETKSGNRLTERNIIPRVNPPEGEGAMGVSLAATGVIKYPWYEAIGRGVTDSINILRFTAVGYATIIKNLVTTGQAGLELSGPVGIAVVTGQAARIGFTYLMQFTALISINLAVLNIIPFPALDGGRLLFIGIEKLRRKPIPKRVEAAVNSIGFALLIFLMIYVTTKDIIKFF